MSAVKLNFYANVLVADIKSRNGYLHTLDHPLIPPGSIFEEAFLFPDTFSTLTSAVQGLDARKYIEYEYDREKSTPGNPVFRGQPLVTLFAPTNFAFGRLPPKLKLYLFSPFGEKALAKVLMYHTVPKTLLLSELYYTEQDSDFWGFKDQTEGMEHFDETSYDKDIIVKPALPNSELHVEIERKKVLPIKDGYKTIIKVNGVYVTVIDVPARNGAIHVSSVMLILMTY